MTGPARRPVAIINVTVHTMDARGTVKGQTVVIENGRVRRMGHVGDVPTVGSDVVELPRSRSNSSIVDTTSSRRTASWSWNP